MTPYFRTRLGRNPHLLAVTALICSVERFEARIIEAMATGLDEYVQIMSVDFDSGRTAIVKVHATGAVSTTAALKSFDLADPCVLELVEEFLEASMSTYRFNDRIDYDCFNAKDWLYGS